MSDAKTPLGQALDGAWAKLAELAAKGAVSAVADAVGVKTVPHALEQARIQALLVVLLPLSPYERKRLVDKALLAAEAVT